MVNGTFENKLSKKGEFFWIRFAALAVLAGRTYQHLFFRPPYTEIFWDERLMKPIINVFGYQWDTFLESNFVLYFQFFAGGILLLGFILLLLTEQWMRRFKIVFLLCGLILTFIAFALFKGNFYRVGQFFEYSAQVGIIFVLFFWLKSSVLRVSIFVKPIRYLVALTFLCHGLYALGYYPVPYTFSMMVWETFPFLTESMIGDFLLFFGILDMVAVFFILFPSNHFVYRTSLWYCVLWGSITAFARIVGTYYAGMPFQSLHEGLYEVIYRLPHAILPLYLLLFDVKKEKVSN
jgi:hypothetical protein